MQLVTDLIQCPFCKSTDIEPAERAEGLAVCCRSCGAAGPTGKDRDEAIARWNMRAKSHG